ncbi:MAG: hypothetical protein QOD06_1103 [Candidatus Binatota bacterium]|nr:hypothetical protein [Candidatus Binatota bacterium]
MGSILDGLKAFCRETDVRFEEGEDGLELVIGGDNGQWPCFAQEIGGERFVFYSYWPEEVPSDKRATMSELLTRANLGLWTGAFEMDLDHGMVRFRTSGSVVAGDLGPEVIAPVFYANVQIMDAYVPGIQEVLSAGRQPAEIIADIEKAAESATLESEDDDELEEDLDDDDDDDEEDEEDDDEDDEDETAASADEPFASCDWCKKPIQYGNASVTVSRSIEQVNWNEEIVDAEVTVIQSESLLTLCAECGNRLDVEDLREDLERKVHALPEKPK